MSDINEMAECLRKAKHGLFSERDNVDEVIKYAQNGSDPAFNLTVAMLMYNTVLEDIAKLLDEKTRIPE